MTRYKNNKKFNRDLKQTGHQSHPAQIEGSVGVQSQHESKETNDIINVNGSLDEAGALARADENGEDNIAYLNVSVDAVFTSPNDKRINGFGDLCQEVNIGKTDVLYEATAYTSLTIEEMKDSRDLSSDEIDEKFYKVAVALRAQRDSEYNIRIILNDLLDSGVAEQLGIKQTELLDRLELSPKEKKQGYRLLRLVIVERNVGEEPGTLCEYHARLLDAIKDPIEQKRTYYVALDLAGAKGKELGSADISDAIKLLEATRQTIKLSEGKLDVGLSEGAPKAIIEKSSRNKKYKAPKLYDEVRQRCNEFKREVIIKLLGFDDDFIELCHQITSSKTEKTERSALVALLTNATSDFTD